MGSELEQTSSLQPFPREQALVMRDARSNVCRALPTAVTGKMCVSRRPSQVRVRLSISAGCLMGLSCLAALFVVGSGCDPRDPTGGEESPRAQAIRPSNSPLPPETPPTEGISSEAGDGNARIAPGEASAYKAEADSLLDNVQTIADRQGLPAAVEALKRAAMLYDKAGDSLLTAEAFSALGSCLQHLHQFAEVVKAREASLRHLNQTYGGQDHHHVALGLENLALALAENGQLVEAWLKRSFRLP